MNKKNYILWKNYNFNEYGKNEIILRDKIRVKNIKLQQSTKEFALTKSKLIYISNNKFSKYISLDLINIKFCIEKLQIIFINSESFFKLFFDNDKDFFKWRNQLKKFTTILDFQKEYNVIDTISKNPHSNIFKVMNIYSKKIYAVKYLRKKDNSIEEIKNEIKIMRKLKNNPYIIKLKEVYENEHSFFLVMEYANSKDLKHCLNNKIKINIDEFIKKILLGIEYIHSKKIVHRDIKPENIFLYRKKNGEFIPKIGDFGIAFKTTEKPIITNIGTLGYIAPEVLNYNSNEKYNFKFEIDIYSIGCLLHFIYLNKNLFKFENIKELKLKNKNNNYDLDNQFYNLDIKIQKMIIESLNKIPNQRIHLNEMIKNYN